MENKSPNSSSFKKPKAKKHSKTPLPFSTASPSHGNLELPDSLAFKSTGFLRRTCPNSASSSSSSASYTTAPSTPSKPPLPYYAPLTNTNVIDFIIPPPVPYTAATYKNGSHFDGLNGISGIDYLKDNFEVISNMGGGEFSDIFHVRSNFDSMEYCIKKTRTRFSSFNDRDRKFKEVTLMLLFSQSDYIVHVVGAWGQFGYLFIQMPFYSRGNLSYFLDTTPIETIHLDIMHRIFIDLILGLKEIHGRDVLHLDLKPANILLDNSGHFLIADFGLAIYSSEASKYDDEGDKSYMAPECLDGFCGKHCDIFSLGLIFLECITGCSLPEDGDVWIRIRQGDFSDVPVVRPDFMDFFVFVKQLLNPNHLIRPTIEQITLHPTIAPLIFQRLQHNGQQK